MVRGQKGAGMLKPLKASDVISAYKDTGSMRGAAQKTVNAQRIARCRANKGGMPNAKKPR